MFPVSRAREGAPAHGVLLELGGDSENPELSHGPPETHGDPEDLSLLEAGGEGMAPLMGQNQENMKDIVEAQEFRVPEEPVLGVHQGPQETQYQQ